VDRGALDAALGLGFPCGGTCPRGRKAEDGPIPECYPLKETKSDDYAQRTEANVRASDGTLILVPWLPLTGGTLLTRELAERFGKPHMIVEMENVSGTQQQTNIAEVLAWLDQRTIERLNVAGPRESGAPGIGRATFEFLSDLIRGFVEPGT